jgi:hypothetical protein
MKKIRFLPILIFPDLDEHSLVLCSVCLLLLGNLCAELSAIWFSLASFLSQVDSANLFFARFGSTIFSRRAAGNSVSRARFEARLVPVRKTFFSVQDLESARPDFPLFPFWVWRRVPFQSPH